MNEQGLKALENLGAELGAAKAENERLRGLLQRVTNELEDLNSAWLEQADDCAEPDEERENCDATQELIDEVRAALSQQPEPTDTYTAVNMATAAAQGFRDGQAAVEQATAQAKPAPAQDDQYPPCDYCGVIPDHHPWHGSGMFNGEDSPHIHACNDCRHLLPTRPAQTEQQPVGRVLTYEESLRSDGKSGPAFWFGPLPAGAFLYAAPIAQTAPQPEQINIDPLLNAGAALSNIAFNLAQRPGVTLDQHVCDLLSSARKRWDAARAALSAQGQSNGDS